MARVGIIGASGFTGAELLRLAVGHPDLEVVLATGDTQAGTAVAALYPSLAAGYPGLVFTPYDAAACAGLDLVFLGLPHGASQGIVPELLGKVGHVVDLAADFRLSDPALYPQWYGEAHTAPELLADFAYGLPELFRAEILALGPRGLARLLSHRRGLGAGTAGAGRAPSRRTASSSTPPPGCRARAGPPSRPRRSAPSTRTSPRTACSTTATPPRSSRPSAPRCSSRRTSPR